MAALPDGSTGTWTFSGVLAGSGPDTRVLNPHPVSAAAAGAAAVAGATSAPFIRVPVDQRSSGARASQGYPPPDECPLVETRVLDEDDAWTVIGELNNAYNDGTRAKFTYGTEQETSSFIGVASKLAGGEFSINGETYISDKGSVADRQARRYARKIRAGFRYEYIEQTGFSYCSGYTWYSVLATQFLGGTQTRKQRGTLDTCARGVVGSHYESGGEFHREVNKAVRWSSGVTVFGVGLTTQSGFNQNVQLDYAFAGRPGKKHYICGSDGRQSAMTAGRVFSGGL